MSGIDLGLGRRHVLKQRDGALERRCRRGQLVVPGSWILMVLKLGLDVSAPENRVNMCAGLCFECFP